MSEVMCLQDYEAATAASRDERLAWFREARFGMFVHFGLYAMYGRNEWVWALENIPKEEYVEACREFNPLSPALRSGPTAGSGAIRQKQIPGSKAGASGRSPDHSQRLVRACAMALTTGDHRPGGTRSPVAFPWVATVVAADHRPGDARSPVAFPP